MITVVAAVMEREGAILIAQRKRDVTHPLKWEFPGGKVEPDELPQTALARELDEELDIEAVIGPEITRYSYQYSGSEPILLIFYSVLDFEGEPHNLNFEEIVWAPRERLPEYDFLEGDREFLLKYCG